ncbi:hypothetical protein SAMN05216389_102148 [Oceanobacillus limi]|uniref:Uncharacterized protein n=1 Tax=Oceanobacillus limi TaxID=930131 RepID=A0A1H9Z9K9_9BACI|nr:hypothetical protein [Oceanobacillus limi]SES78026.1 hypothetical protein SAMN05216389_102148 [Oceanobacillus limi]
MAFGLKREELHGWKIKVDRGEIAFLTHYWIDERFPGCNTVTKVGCCDIEKLAAWGEKYNLKREWIHMDPNYPHFDLFGERQKNILYSENRTDHITRFKL